MLLKCLYHARKVSGFVHICEEYRFCLSFYDFPYGFWNRSDSVEHFPDFNVNWKSALVQPRLFSAVFLALLVIFPFIVSSADCISRSSMLIDTFSFLYRLCIVHTWLAEHSVTSSQNLGCFIPWQWKQVNAETNIKEQYCTRKKKNIQLR